MDKKILSVMMLTLLLIGMLTLAFNIQPAKADPKTIYVNDDNTEGPWDGTQQYPYQNITSGLEHASTGDTIFVYEGTYYEYGVAVKKSVSLVGENRSVTEIITSQIWVWASDVSISNFTISGDLIVQGSKNNYFFNNVLNSSKGVWLDRSSNNTFRRNNFSNSDGFAITPYKGLGYYAHTIDPSNTINEKPIYYWVNQHDKQIPTDAGFVAVINCTNISIRNLVIQSVEYGVLLAYTEASWIENLNASENWGGIEMRYSHNIIVRNNTLSDCLWGIHLRSSNNNTIHDNLIDRSDVGIYFGESHRNTLERNTATSNYEGLHLDASDNNTVNDNILRWNSVGVADLTDSDYNLIYHNNFINNTKQVYHYLSHVMNETNFWDNGYPSGGNYWSDYIAKGGYDADGDGIGDVPYVIDDYNQDNYPLMEPYSPFPRTIEELETEIEELGLEGEIDNQGIVKSLIAKLNTAQKLVDKGKIDEARSILEEDFIPQVQNLSDIHITPEAADILIKSAEYIMSHL